MISERAESRQDQIDPFALKRPEGPLPAHKYPIDREILRSLNPEEKKMLDLFTNLGEQTAYLYQIQTVNSFYPDRMSQDEFERVSKKDNDVMSEYTYVRRDPQTGELISKAYHEVFKNEIKELGIVPTLKEAALQAHKLGDYQLQAYLRARATAFTRGNWTFGDKLWMQMDHQPKVFIVIGPYDSYIDPKKRKNGWEGWVTILNPEKTEVAQARLDKIRQWSESERRIAIPKVGVRVDTPVQFFGQADGKGWTGQSLPNQREIRQTDGSVLIIFNEVFEEKFKNRRLPILKDIIDPHIRSRLPAEFLKEVSFNMYIGHETDHARKPEGIGSRLKQHHTWIEEEKAELFGLRTIFALAQSRREKEAAVALAFTNGMLEYLKHLEGDARSDYFPGASILLGHTLEAGTVKIEDGYLTWDQDKIEKTILKLADQVESIAETGKLEDALQFAESNYQEDVYAPLKKPEKRVALFRIPQRPSSEADEITDNSRIISTN